MKLFKVFLSLFLLVGVFFLVSLFFPRTYRIERTTTIAQPAHEVFTFMSDLRNWPEWSVWNKDLDTSLYVFYGRRSDSTGGRQYFHGSLLGSGRFLITHTKQDTLLGYNLHMHEGEVEANGTFLFGDKAGASTLTWIDSGDVGYNPIYRYMIPSKVSSTEEAFDKGLARIKQVLEERKN